MVNKFNYIAGFGLPDVALTAAICMALIATFIFQRRRVAMKAQSRLPVLPDGKILATDPNKNREFGGECCHPYASWFGLTVKSWKLMSRMDCGSVYISIYSSSPRRTVVDKTYTL